MSRSSVLSVILAIAAPLLPGSAFCQAQEPAASFPSRPVTAIAAFAAGGPNDKEMRAESDKLQELLGQQFIIDYKTGASGNIAAAYVARSRPDGYTLLVNLGSFTTNPALYKDLPFDTLKDFAPITLASKKPFIFVVRPGFAASGVSEYLAFAKANPGKVNWGTSGVGSLQHLVGEWLNGLTGTRTTFIPYKGTAPILLDLTASRLDIAPMSLAAALPFIKAGKLRAIGISDDKRSPAIASVPTVMEQGVAGYNFTTWLGYTAPAATPPAILAKLSEYFVKAVRSPEVTAALESDGAIPVGSTPAQYRALLVTEIERWKKVVQDNGIRIEE